MSWETKLRVGSVIAIAAAMAYLLFKFHQFQLVISSGKTGVTGGGGGGPSKVATEPSATFWEWLLADGGTPDPPSGNPDVDPGQGVIITTNPDGSTTAVDTGGGTITGTGAQPGYPNNGVEP